MWTTRPGPLANVQGQLPTMIFLQRIPANKGHSPNAVLMLHHRLQRWPNIETALGECTVSAEDVNFPHG